MSAPSKAALTVAVAVLAERLAAGEAQLAAITGPQGHLRTGKVTVSNDEDPGRVVITVDPEMASIWMERADGVLGDTREQSIACLSAGDRVGSSLMVQFEGRTNYLDDRHLETSRVHVEDPNPGAGLRHDRDRQRGRLGVRRVGPRRPAKHRAVVDITARTDLEAGVTPFIDCGHEDMCRGLLRGIVARDDVAARRRG